MTQFLNYRNWVFPEALYLPVCDKAEYYNKIEVGALHARRSSVFICGLIRNAEQYIYRLFSRIEKIRDLFDESTVFLYENDSDDATPFLLSRFNCGYKSEKLKKKRHDNDTSYERTVDMAHYRNQYLTEYRNGKCYDYVIVLDTDLNGGYSYEGILHSLALNCEVVTSNGLLYQHTDQGLVRNFYDTWAYRRLDHPEAHNSGEINKLWYNRGEPPIRVLSGFGGMAIYRGDILRGSEVYLAGDCDHPTLHKQLGAEVWLNPSQITLYNEW